MSTGPASPARPRGALRSPAHRAFAAPAHKATPVPDSFYKIPPTLSFWGNNQFGLCVTTEECFAKAGYSLYVGSAELFITEATCIAWARKHGWLNGAYLTEVMDAMAVDGIVATDGKTYTDGPYQSVDWTNDAILSSAIFQGPVKIGVAAGQLENSVGSHNGWWGTGWSHDGNIDHCVSLCGFGSAAALAAAVGVSVPSNVDPNTRCYLLFTWNTIGIVDRASMMAITAEAWLRTPTTPQTPIPPPPPPPPPPPTGTTPSVSDLSVSPTTSVAGDPVSLFATVSAGSGETGVPSGTVQFLIGTTILGTGTLSGGKASATTTSIPAGPSSIIATYLGDSVFAPSTSSAVTVSVTPPPTPPPPPPPSTVGKWDAAAQTVTLPAGWTASSSWFGQKVTVNPGSQTVSMPRGWKTAPGSVMGAIDVNSLIQEILVILEPLAKAIDRQAMGKIASEAFMNGGFKAVVPALVTRINEWITNPMEAMVVAIVLNQLPSIG